MIDYLMIMLVITGAIVAVVTIVILLLAFGKFENLKGKFNNTIYGGLF